MPPNADTGNACKSDLQIAGDNTFPEKESILIQVKEYSQKLESSLLIINCRYSVTSSS